ncbi:MAG: HEAT repeat domain-containing protein [Campylobacterota bacterium]
MGFIKSKESDFDERTFDDFIEAKDAFEDSSQPQDLRLKALAYMLNHNEISYVLKDFNKMFAVDNLESHVYIDYAFSNFPTKLKRDEDFENMVKMLRTDNAYLRNMVIKYLQSFGKEIKPFLEHMLEDGDKDVRIFAVNIIGDVGFEDSVSLLRYVLVRESDLNVIATAIDYLGEIGNGEDKELLEAVRKNFADEPYIEFAINNAIERLDG